jgi:regulator of replication initiation timing
MDEAPLLPPRIPRGEAVGERAIRTRLWDIEQEIERLAEDFASNQREYETLLDKNHILRSEYDRLWRKLHKYEDE